MREHYRSDLYSLILDIYSWSLSKTSDLMGARLHTTHMQQEPCGSYNPNEQFIVISMILEEVIEALHPPVALPSLLCPLAVSRLTLHSPGHSPPEQDLYFVLISTLRLLTVSPPPVHPHITVQLRLPRVAKHEATPGRFAPAHRDKQVQDPHLPPGVVSEHQAQGVFMPIIRVLQHGPSGGSLVATLGACVRTC